MLRANNSSSVHELKNGSPIVEKWIEEDSLFVIVAGYSPETDLVEFLDRVPGT